MLNDLFEVVSENNKMQIQLCLFRVGYLFSKIVIFSMLQNLNDMCSKVSNIEALLNIH